MKHVVMFSGGLSSWAAARRVVEAVGTEGLVLLFADTLIEDPDLYRFLEDASRDIGVPVTRIADGRTPWEVFRDKRFLGNSRVDPCSEVLKRNLMDRWVEENCKPAETTLYFGITWDEAHRFKNLRERKAPWDVRAPLCYAPFLGRPHMTTMATNRGLTIPRLYEMGFPHNNCGGGCVKAGQGHFMLLLQKLPEVYAEWERNEQALRDDLGRDVSILRDRRGGETKPMTLRELRERVKAGDKTLDRFEWGGCGCAVDA